MRTQSSLYRSPFFLSNFHAQLSHFTRGARFSSSLVATSLKLQSEYEVIGAPVVQKPLGESQKGLSHASTGFDGMSHLGKIVVRVELAETVWVVMKVLVVDKDDFKP